MVIFFLTILFLSDLFSNPLYNMGSNCLLKLKAHFYADRQMY